MLRLVAGGVLATCCVATGAHAADKAPERLARAAAPGDYRLHARVAAPSAPRIVDAPGSRLRTAFGGSMVGLYPLPDSGLHVSAGGRLFGRPGHQRSADLEAERLLSMPRGAGVGGRFGRRRPSPAMLVGLDQPVAGALVVGIDGGAAMGRLYSAPGRLGRMAGRGGGGNAGGLNEMGRLTMSYRF